VQLFLAGRHEYYGSWDFFFKKQLSSYPYTAALKPSCPR
jgi:hypothetical protein